MESGCSTIQLVYLLGAILINILISFITLLCLCACIVAIFAANNAPTLKDKRDKRQLLPFGYGAYGYPYYPGYPYSGYPYGYAASPYTAYSTYGAYASPFAYPGVAAPIVAAPFGYFR